MKTLRLSEFCNDPRAKDTDNHWPQRFTYSKTHTKCGMLSLTNKTY